MITTIAVRFNCVWNILCPGRRKPFMTFFLVSLGGVRLSQLGTSATTCLLYQLRMIDYDECVAVGGMRIGRGNRSTRRKAVPVPLCPPQIPHDLTWTGTRAATVGSRRLTAWAMTRPYSWLGIAITSFVDIHPLHGCYAVSMFEITHVIYTANHVMTGRH
jgi:hypothetical protein